MLDVKEKIRDIYLVIEDIKKFPQTYNSILQEHRHSGTCQTMLRRKLNQACKDGFVCKTSIPGTRFGKVIFYCIPKEYYILVEADRIGSNVYCFFDYERVSRFYMKTKNCWILKRGFWEEVGEKVFFEGNVLKFI